MRDNFALTPLVLTQIQGLDFLGVYHTQDLDSFKSDGLVGLGPKKYYEKNYPEDRRVLVSEMQKSGVIDKAIFSVKLGKVNNNNPQNIKETKSSIQFGGWSDTIVDNSYNHLKEEDQGIKWFQPNTDNRWQVSFNKLKINSLEIPLSGRNQVAILDTGTSFFYMPKPEFKQFYQEIKKS